MNRHCRVHTSRTRLHKHSLNATSSGYIRVSHASVQIHSSHPTSQTTLMVSRHEPKQQCTQPSHPIWLGSKRPDLICLNPSPTPSFLRDTCSRMRPVAPLLPPIQAARPPSPAGRSLCLGLQWGRCLTGCLLALSAPTTTGLTQQLITTPFQSHMSLSPCVPMTPEAFRPLPAPIKLLSIRPVCHTRISPSVMIGQPLIWKPTLNGSCDPL